VGACASNAWTERENSINKNAVFFINKIFIPEKDLLNRAFPELLF
jgi:hypothetical protein